MQRQIAPAIAKVLADADIGYRIGEEPKVLYPFPVFFFGQQVAAFETRAIAEAWVKEQQAQFH